jgi:hypothetical protein
LKIIINYKKKTLPVNGKLQVVLSELGQWRAANTIGHPASPKKRLRRVILGYRDIRRSSRLIYLSSIKNGISAEPDKKSRAVEWFWPFTTRLGKFSRFPGETPGEAALKMT